MHPDGSTGFCWAECRLQRDQPDDLSADPEESVKVFADWCGRYGGWTNTAMIELFRAQVWVCENCRTELDEPDDISEKVECDYWGKVTFTVEMGRGS